MGNVVWLLPQSGYVCVLVCNHNTKLVVIMWHVILMEDFDILDLTVLIFITPAC